MTDTICVVSVVDSSFTASLDALKMEAFEGGMELALVACVFSAAIVMLGVAVHRAVSAS